MAITLKQLADLLQQSASERDGALQWREIDENDRNAGRLLDVMLAAGLINEETTIQKPWETLATLMWWLVYWRTAFQGEPDPLVAELAALRERAERAEQELEALRRAALDLLQQGKVELRKLNGSMHSAVIYPEPRDLENFLAQFGEDEIDVIETDWSE